VKNGFIPGEPRANGATSAKQESVLVRWIATYYMQTLEQLGDSQSGEQTRAVKCLYFSIEKIRMGTAMTRNMQAQRCDRRND
jgi:hypothetical protein